MDTDENKGVVTQFIEAINGQRWSDLDNLVLEDVVRLSGTSAQPDVRNLSELKEFLKTKLWSFPTQRNRLMS